PAFDLVPFAEAMQRECVLVRSADGRLCFAVTDPFNANLRAWAEAKVEQAFEWGFAHRLDVAAYLMSQEKNMRAMDTMLANDTRDTAGEETAEDLSLKTISEDSSTVVRLVNSTLYDALKAGASDIHLEMSQSAMMIKYRIDGVLAAVGTVKGADIAEQMISRIKVMSDLDIAERRVPQDGRFKVSARGREIDFRVSIMPSIFGEDAVLRILDKQNLVDEANGLRLDILGFDAGTLVTFRRLCNEPYGMVLVTGPTGSGKTTSLYAAVSEINHGRDKIITIEDPVEYQLPGVLQIPVNEKKGLTFARGLRSILRHDPDKILVGEIRDAETAQIAVQAALTGHLVFTTVHANSVFDVIGRFTHMGVDPYSLVSALNGVMAQRLVRLNCPHCTERAEPDPQLLSDSNLSPDAVRDFDFHAGRGCGQCRGSGYRGRNAISEMLVLDDKLREMIVAKEPVSSVKQAARSKGTRFLREAAVELVRQGKTSLQEINRVTFVA
ncbi:MAG TPA: GspE/PulE family protein, partial [Burkholderiales bacterium]|nr:GspE/PulE family protein [Burkholderiales bacterium]